MVTTGSGPSHAGAARDVVLVLHVGVDQIVAVPPVEGEDGEHEEVQPEDEGFEWRHSMGRVLHALCQSVIITGLLRCDSPHPPASRRAPRSHGAASPHASGPGCAIPAPNGRRSAVLQFMVADRRAGMLRYGAPLDAGRGPPRRALRIPSPISIPICITLRALEFPASSTSCAAGPTPLGEERLRHSPAPTRGRPALAHVRDGPVHRTAGGLPLPPPRTSTPSAPLAVEHRALEPRGSRASPTSSSRSSAAHNLRRADGTLPAPLGLAEGVTLFGREIGGRRRAIDPAGEVFDHASPELRSLRDRLRRQRARLRGTLESYMRGRDTARYLQDQVVTDRNGRYVLLVRAEHRSAIPGIVHGASGSGASLFLEPLSTVEINNDIVALQEQEAGRSCASCWRSPTLPAARPNSARPRRRGARRPAGEGPLPRLVDGVPPPVAATAPSTCRPRGTRCSSRRSGGWPAWSGRRRRAPVREAAADGARGRPTGPPARPCSSSPGPTPAARRSR